MGISSWRGRRPAHTRSTHRSGDRREVRQGERAHAVAPELGSVQREERRVLVDRQQLPVRDRAARDTAGEDDITEDALRAAVARADSPMPGAALRTPHRAWSRPPARSRPWGPAARRAGCSRRPGGTGSGDELPVGRIVSRLDPGARRDREVGRAVPRHHCSGCGGRVGRRGRPGPAEDPGCGTGRAGRTRGTGRTLDACAPVSPLSPCTPVSPVSPLSPLAPVAPAAAMRCQEVPVEPGVTPRLDRLPRTSSPAVTRSAGGPPGRTCRRTSRRPWTTASRRCRPSHLPPPSRRLLPSADGTLESLSPGCPECPGAPGVPARPSLRSPRVTRRASRPRGPRSHRWLRSPVAPVAPVGPRLPRLLLSPWPLTIRWHPSNPWPLSHLLLRSHPRAGCNPGHPSRRLHPGRPSTSVAPSGPTEPAAPVAPMAPAAAGGATLRLPHDGCGAVRAGPSGGHEDEGARRLVHAPVARGVRSARVAGWLLAAHPPAARRRGARYRRSRR